MLVRVTREDILENWEDYKEQFKVAATSSEGGIIALGDNFEEASKVIYERLTNPFNTNMQLWTSVSDSTPDYIGLTQLQQCEFTNRKTLLLFTITKLNEVDKETMQNMYMEAYEGVSQFAKEQECIGMTCYSDLEYFAEKAKETKDWTGVITRYFFYFPLGD